MRQRKRKKPWRLIKRKGRAYIQVVFDHIPGGCFSSGTEDEFEADRWAEQKYLHDTGRLVQQRDITLKEFATDFFDPVKDPKGFVKRQVARGYSYEDTEYQRRQGYLDNYILKAHGGMLLDSISDVLIEDFIIGLKSVKTKRDLSNDTKNKILSAYSDVMKEAKRQGYIKVNPCESVDRMAVDDGGRRPFTEEGLALFFPKDREELLFIWRSLMWAVYFLVMRDTGWRPGEVAGLSVENWYPEIHGVATTGSVSWHDRQYRESVKTSRKGLNHREGFLSEQTAELLEELIRYNPERKHLFLMEDGTFMWSATANEHLRDAAARAHVELDGRTQYSFRHSFQSYYIGRMPELARLVLMGHTHTRAEYTHLTPEQRLHRVIEMDGVEEALKNR